MNKEENNKKNKRVTSNDYADLEPVVLNVDINDFITDEESKISEPIVTNKECKIPPLVIMIGIIIWFTLLVYLFQLIIRDKNTNNINISYTNNTTSQIVIDEHFLNFPMKVSTFVHSGFEIGTDLDITVNSKPTIYLVNYKDKLIGTITIKGDVNGSLLGDCYIEELNLDYFEDMEIAGVNGIKLKSNVTNYDFEKLGLPRPNSYEIIVENANGSTSRTVNEYYILNEDTGDTVYLKTIDNKLSKYIININ